MCFLRLCWICHFPYSMYDRIKLFTFRSFQSLMFDELIVVTNQSDKALKKIKIQWVSNIPGWCCCFLLKFLFLNMLENLYLSGLLYFILIPLFVSLSTDYLTYYVIHTHVLIYTLSRDKKKSCIIHYIAYIYFKENGPDFFPTLFTFCKDDILIDNWLISRRWHSKIWVRTHYIYTSAHPAC